MRLRTLSDKLYAAAGATAITGIGLTMSMIFAGAGIALLAVSAALFMIGLMIQLINPAPRPTARPRPATPVVDVNQPSEARIS